MRRNKGKLKLFLLVSIFSSKEKTTASGSCRFTTNLILSSTFLSIIESLIISKRLFTKSIFEDSIPLMEPTAFSTFNAHVAQSIPSSVKCSVS